MLPPICKVVCQIDWETLPVVRDPLENYYYDFDDEDTYEDADWSEEYYSYFKSGDKVKKMYISKKQVMSEIATIQSWLDMSGAYPGFDRIDWTGNYLRVGIDGVMNDVGERYDLLDMIPGLREVPKSQLRDSLRKTSYIL